MTSETKPPRTVNVHEAKTQLSRLLEQVEAGEHVVIARAGKPIAQLVPYRPHRAPRVPGLLKGQGFWMAPDFDELPAELVPYFQGEMD